MGTYRVHDAAGRRIDDIYAYTRSAWGDAQAEHYIRGLFAKFGEIAEHRIAWRAIPKDLGVDLMNPLIQMIPKVRLRS